jgi:transposase
MADRMSTMATTGTPRGARRRRSEECKTGAVRLAFDEGKTVGQVARKLDLIESALRSRLERTRADRTKGRTGLTSEEREELRRDGDGFGDSRPI